MKDLLKNVKAQITAGVGIVLATLGTVFTDKVEEFFGVEGEETEAAVAVEQKQEVNVTGPVIIINIPEQQPVKEKVIVKEVPAKPKKTETEKRKDEGLDW